MGQMSGICSLLFATKPFLFYSLSNSHLSVLKVETTAITISSKNSQTNFLRFIGSVKKKFAIKLFSTA